ncbi:MAG: DMT family transporter [Campylobacteraceae bacterium]
MTKTHGFLLALFAATLWGLSGVCGQFLFSQRAFNVEWLISIRLMMAGVILLFIAKLQNTDLFIIFKDKKDSLKLLIFSIFGMLATQYTFFKTIFYSNAPTATVLTYFGLIFIVFYTSFIARKIPSILEFISLFLAMLGIFSLVTHFNLGTLVIKPDALFWGFCSAFALATYTILPITLLFKYKATLVVGFSMLIAGIVIGVFTPLLKVEGIWDIWTVINLLVVIIPGGVMAFLAYLVSVKIIGAKYSGLVASFEPLSAAIFTVLLLHVKLTIYDWLGGFMIVFAVVLLFFKK